MKRTIDTAIITLCLLAATGAECIPLLLVLTAIAGGLIVWKEVSYMAYYRTCPYCGAALDPGEHCDCQGNKEAAPVLAHRDGMVEKDLTEPTSTS